MKHVRWGIIGPGWVAGQFASDLCYAEGACLEAIVSRSSPERAQAFAKLHAVRKVYDEYEAFLSDQDIDIVYIATLNPSHCQIALDCIRAGKHVLCEKPFALNTQEGAEMIRAARSAGVFLMEAMWSRFLPVETQVRSWLAEGRIGEVRFVRADHGVLCADRSGRQFRLDAGGGALLDIGVYPLAFITMVLGCEPEEIGSVASLAETGVDEQSALCLRYCGGKIATLSQTFLAESPQEAWIVGTQGYIRIKAPFINAERVQLIAESKLSDGTSFTEERFLPVTGNGYHYEADEAMRCLRCGALESQLMPLRETLGILRIMDCARAQWGLRYPGESSPSTRS